MKDDLNLKRFLRDWTGTCIHFHAQGNEGRHEEFLSEFMKFRVPHILVNAKVYKGSERFFIQYLAGEFGFPKMSNMAVLEAYLSYLMMSDFRCVFVFTNAEEMSGFSSLLIQNFLKFISMNPKNMKLLTISTLPWNFIEARLLNFRTSIDAVVHRLPGFTSEELTKAASSISGVSSNPTDPTSIQSLAAYLPKNKNPIFLKKLIASRNPQNDVESFQSLPATVALAFICSYIATWNPQSTDQRFVGEKELKRRRAPTQIDTQEFHETSARHFSITRLGNLYSAMHKNLQAECGPFKANVQIPILLQFGHLEQISDVHNLIKPTFRCSSSFDYVERVFNNFVKKHTTQASLKTTTDDFRSYLYNHQL